MRIPLEYLAGLFTAGDTAPVELALRRLAAMRSYMRDVFVDNPTNEEIPASVGMTPEKVKEMYRLLSIAKYDDRFVIPTAHPEMPRGIKELEGCPVSYDVEAFHGLAPPRRTARWVARRRRDARCSPLRSFDEYFVGIPRIPTAAPETEMDPKDARGVRMASRSSWTTRGMTSRPSWTR